MEMIIITSVAFFIGFLVGCFASYIDNKNNLKK